jgi:hypothetical protein
MGEYMLMILRGKPRTGIPEESSFFSFSSLTQLSFFSFIRCHFMYACQRESSSHVFVLSLDCDLTARTIRRLPDTDCGCRKFIHLRSDSRSPTSTCMSGHAHLNMDRFGHIMSAAIDQTMQKM